MQSPPSRTYSATMQYKSKDSTKKKSSGFSLLGSIGQLFGGDRSRSARNDAPVLKSCASEPLEVASSMSYASPMSQHSLGAASNEQRAPIIKDALLALISLQLFDGSWDPKTPRLFTLIFLAAAKTGASDGAASDGAASGGAALDDAASDGAASGDAAPIDPEKRYEEFCAKEGALRATALAIVAMRIGQSERREEWAMIEEKAVDWLKERVESSDAETTTSAEQHLEEAEKVLKSTQGKSYEL